MINELQIKVFWETFRLDNIYKLKASRIFYFFYPNIILLSC